MVKGRERPAAAGLRHLELRCAIETPPAEYGLAMLASSGKSDIEVEADVETDFPCGPARGMAFVRFTPRSRRQQEDFVF